MPSCDAVFIAADGRTLRLRRPIADAIDADAAASYDERYATYAAYYAADAAMIIFSSCRFLLFSRYAAAAAFDISAMLDDRYTFSPRSSRRHADGRLLMPRHAAIFAAAAAAYAVIAAA